MFFLVINLLNLATISANFYWANWEYKTDPDYLKYKDICNVITNPGNEKLDTYLDLSIKLFNLIFWQYFLIWILYPSAICSCRCLGGQNDEQ